VIDSGSDYQGSNPCPPAIVFIISHLKEPVMRDWLFLF
jgi:hypothetical protein